MCKRLGHVPVRRSVSIHYYYYHYWVSCESAYYKNSKTVSGGGSLSKKYENWMVNCGVTSLAVVG